MQYRDLEVCSSIAPGGCCTRIKRVIARVGSPASRGELQEIVSNFRRFLARGGDVPVNWGGIEDVRAEVAKVVDLSLVGNALTATVQSCDVQDIQSLKQSPKWWARVSDSWRDGKGNAYSTFLMYLFADPPKRPTPSNTAKQVTQGSSQSLSKEGRPMATRNYSLLKKHVFPNRRQWMSQNATGRRVRNMAITNDSEGGNVSIPDFVRWWNMLISSSQDPDLEAYMITKTPATAQELQMMLTTMESIMKKRAGIEEEQPPEDAQSLQDLSLVEQSQRLFNRVKELHRPYSELPEQEQDRRQRAFWGR